MRYLLAVSLILVAIPAWGASIEVLEANGNSVNDLSGPNSIGFNIEWEYAKPIVLRIHINANDTAPEIAFGGSVCNSGSTRWNGFHLTLENGAIWKSMLTTWMTSDKVMMEGDYLPVGTIFVYNTCTIKELKPCKSCELHNIAANRIIKQTSADFGFNPTLPAGGFPVIGGFKHTGSSWSIDRTLLGTVNSFIVRLTPNLDGMRVQEQH